MASLFGGSNLQQDLAAAANTDLYTCPDGYSTMARVFLCNRNAGTVKIRLMISRNGDVLANSHYLYYDYDLAPGEPLDVQGLQLNEKDIIRARTDTANVSANLIVQTTATLVKN